MTEIGGQLAQILDLAISHGASDVLIIEGVTPVLRIDGSIVPVQNTEVLTVEVIKNWIAQIMTSDQQKEYLAQKELDFSFPYSSHRFRVNAFHQKGSPALALRLIQADIRGYDVLGLPPILSRFTQAKQGFVVITGPTGHGKSTTLAAMIEEINQTRSGHIITIEDPIEYIFPHGRSIISQREVGLDTHSFARALRSAMREDPNIILVGEMRDFETVEAALTLAETGHLVFSTLHTNSAAQSCDRMVDMFPPYIQEPVRKQLANVLLGIVSQRLIPKVGGGRVVAAELLISTPAVKSLIRDNRTHQLDNIIATSAADGMISLDKVIAELISKGEITLDDGLLWANDQKAVKSMVY